ncbi:MAG: ThuA domain-containing protein [Planctomycetes bacterium]|nr:ThuA domain-containing protein [Planctomycetota bacterium]
MTRLFATALSILAVLNSCLAAPPTLDELRKELKSFGPHKKLSKEDKKKRSRVQGQITALESKDSIEKFVKTLKAHPVKKDRKILIYSRTTGFRHASIPTGVLAISLLGEHTGAYSSDATEDPSVFTKENLAQYDAILMLSTTKDPIPHGKARDAFEDFLTQGKGLIGIHAATDCHADWPYYLDAIGGIFNGHPWTSKDLITLYNEEPEHPVVKSVPQGYVIKDEIYQYKDDEHFTRDKLRILLSLDLSGKNMKKKNMRRKDHDYAVSWVKSYHGSKVFYSNLGHNNSTFTDKVAMKHFLDGIQFVLGDVEADSRPSAEVGNGKPKAPPAGF